METYDRALPDGSVRGRKWTAPLAVLTGVLMVGALVSKLDIVLALAAVVCLGVLLAMLAKPGITTLVVLFVMYSNLAVVSIRFHKIPQFLGACFFLLLGLPLANYLLAARQSIIINRVFPLMLAYFPAILASALLSNDAGQSVQRIVAYLLEGIVLYFLVLNTVRTPALLRKVVWTLVLAGCLMGTLSVYQEATHSYNRSFGGLAQIEQEEIGTGQTNFQGKAQVRPRLAGPIGEPNRYAQIMLVLLPLAVSCVLAERSWFLRALAALSCIPILGGVLLSFSRGAALSVLFIVCLMVYLRYIKVSYAIASLVAVTLVVVVAAPDYVHRISTLAGLSSGNAAAVDSSIRGRAAENLAALRLFLEHPLLGVGAGQAHLYIPHYANETGLKLMEGTRRGHNMYLEELADTGLVGFLVFMAIVIATLRELIAARRRWIRRRPDWAHTITGFLLAVVGYLTSAVFAQLSYIRYYWVLLALAGVAARVFDAESEAALPNDT